MVSPQSHTSSSATSAVSTTTPRQHVLATPQQHVAATLQQHVVATHQQQATTQHQEDTTPAAATDTVSQQRTYLPMTTADNYLPTTPAVHASMLHHDESNLPPSLLFDKMYEFPVVKVEEDENFI